MNGRRVTAAIGLGSNLDDPVRQVRAGIASLASLAGSRVLACSGLYRSAPLGVTAQPDFVNAVCLIETSLEAPSLMRALLEIERRHGRVRSAEKGGPRVLDLDLLLYGEEVLESAEVTVPHPRMHERAFVLAPLAELLPDLVVPGRGPVRSLLAACAGQRVQKIP